MVELRDAEPADAPGIAAVHVASWRAAYRGLVPDEVLAGLSVPDRSRLWSDRLTEPEPGTQIVVASAAHGVVGFVAVGPPREPAARADRTLGDVYALYLGPDSWGRGIGALLHAAALDRLRTEGCTQAGLWVLHGNERARRFYRRRGWTDTGHTRIDRVLGDIALHERRLRRGLTA